MKVILLENLRKIGSIGEVIDVKRGFARNFLIANKLVNNNLDSSVIEFAYQGPQIKYLSLIHI